MAASRLGLAALLLWPLCGAPQAAQARVVVPIHQRVMTDGVRRYGVPVSVDGEVVEAALDTGSSGLLLLPGKAASSEHGPRRTYVFSGGVRLEGVEAAADLALGEARGRTRAQRISKIGCVDARPRCSAAALSLDRFGFEGDGLPGEGFRALLGLGLAGPAQDHPLRALGARRWIVSLPRPQDQADGRLVLDPTDEEVAGFVFLPMIERLAWRRDGAHDAVEGCLEAAEGARRVCGPALLDTGAAGVAVVNAGGAAAEWAVGARLILGDGRLPPVAIAPGARAVAVGRGVDMPTPIILAGAAPYLAFDVLYDPENRRIGLRPRP